MRRADERRSASVMIRSSIKWSLAGNDVDWMMKTSEPRTFSWISTKISMSAKRRTVALVSGRCSQSAISCASTGLELPATSLIEPFLADIDASPRVLLDTTFSISRNPGNRRVSMSEEISGRRLGWQPIAPVFPGKNRPLRDYPGVLLPAAEAQRRDTKCTLCGCGLVRARNGGAAAARGRRGGRVRGAVDHVAQPAETGLRDFPQQQVVGRRPGIASGLAGRLLA